MAESDEVESDEAKFDEAASTEAQDEDLEAPAEAFRLFSHDLRIDILLELWRASGDGLTYSELQERVGERDSGKFNYHLSKLVGHFVDHEGDRYALRYAGHRVIDAIRSGALHRQAVVEDVQLSTPCPTETCDASLAFAYAGQHGTVRCRSCATTVLEYPVDPGGVVDRTPAAVVDVFDRRVRHRWLAALSGTCPICAGDVRATVTDRGATSCQPVAARESSTYGTDHPVLVSVDCDRCSFFGFLPVGAALLDHPAVLGFLYDRGVDVRATRLWELDFVIDPTRVTVRETDPWSVAVSVDGGHETLRATLDETATVRSITRRTAADVDAGTGPTR